MGLAVLCVVSALAEPQRLNLFIWSEYIDPAVVAEFERQENAKVVIDLYEDDAAMMAKLQAGGASQYDVVVPPDHRIPGMIKLGLLAPLRHANLPNLGNLEARFRGLPFDPKNEYTVAYQWGSVGLYLRRTAGETVPDSWGVLFDPAQQRGNFVLIDSARDLIGAALKYRGLKLNDTDPRHLRDVRDLLLEAKKRCVGFDGGVGGRNKVLARLARAAIVYNGDAARGMADDPETTYVIPREGSILWVDNLAILAKAPHRERAERFLNFCLDARVGARISNFTRFATPNRAAREFIRPEDLANPAIYPPADAMARLEFLEPIPAATRLYDEVWTQVKAK